MAEQKVNFFATFYIRLKNFLTNRKFITDVVVRLVITFGVILIIGGLYTLLMLTNQVSQSSSAIDSVLTVIWWIPGIPLFLADVYDTTVTTIGIISFVLGIDLFLVGLGLWVRHPLARLTAIIIFGLGAFFQLVEFFYIGYMGIPSYSTPTIFALIVEVILLYFLLSRFDSKNRLKDEKLANLEKSKPSYA